MRIEFSSAQSRAYQEAKEEGLKEGFEKGKRIGFAVVKMAAMKMSTETIAAILEVDEQLVRRIMVKVNERLRASRKGKREMIQQAVTELSQLYEADETAWLEATADLIQQEARDELDYTHLSDYLSDMARRDRREVKSRLTTLLARVLKWAHQPDQRSSSWRGTIVEQRQELSGLVTPGVLRNHAQAILADAYAQAAERAAAETGLAAQSFPDESPYTLEQLLSPDFPSETAR